MLDAFRTLHEGMCEMEFIEAESNMNDLDAVFEEEQETDVEDIQVKILNYFFWICFNIFIRT